MSSNSPLRPPGEITLRTEDGRCVLRLSGEIDSAVVEAFEAAPPTALLRGTPVEVVDAAEVTFLNSLGLRLLLQLTEPTRAAGRRPLLRRPSRATLQLIRMTHLDELFDVGDRPAEPFTA